MAQRGMSNLGRARTASSDADNQQTPPFSQGSMFLLAMNSHKPIMGLQLGKSPNSLPDVSGDSTFVDGSTQIQGQTISMNNNIYTGSRKASNFPGLKLRIGSWEYVARSASDFVVKYFFSRQKLSWEMISGTGLKCKIDMTWSDILDLQYYCPETGPGFLSIMLSRKPLFYLETRLGPRSHTTWELTNDFTHGQASLHRRHFLQCSEGALNKHLEFFNYLRQNRTNNVIACPDLMISEGGSQQMMNNVNEDEVQKDNQ